MSSAGAQEVECRWCGAKAPEGAEACPLCRRPLPRGEFRALDSAEPAVQVPAPPRSTIGPGVRREPPREREPLVPAPGQEALGSWASIRQILRRDKLFGAVLVLIALQVLAALVRHKWAWAVISAFVLWRLVTFRRQGFWAAIIMAGCAVTAGVLLTVLFVAAASSGLNAGTTVLAQLAALLGFTAANGFVLWVVWTRKDMFD